LEGEGALFAGMQETFLLGLGKPSKRPSKSLKREKAHGAPVGVNAKKMHTREEKLFSRESRA